MATAALPARWRQPVVDAVVLPAHAQLSVVFSLSCSAVNDSITPGTPEAIQMTIDPAPGPGIPIQAVGTCPTGGTVFNVTVAFDFTTGQANTTVNLIPGQCTPGETLTVLLTANTLGGASDSCLFTVNPPPAPP